jgi:hypothetical protein
MRKLSLSLLLAVATLVTMAVTVFADGTPSGW